MLAMIAGVVGREELAVSAESAAARRLARSHRPGRGQLLTKVQPGWYVQAVGLSDAQGVGVPVQVVAGPDHPEQSSCWPHVV
jgi:hypothetical protein